MTPRPTPLALPPADYLEVLRQAFAETIMPTDLLAHLLDRMEGRR